MKLVSAAHPLVSIIMPVYNGGDFVSKAIDSVLGQSYTNFEFLIINDGSTDKSHNVIKKYRDSRIRYVSRENEGLAKTLIQLVEMSTGTLIARMDADDVCYPDRIKTQVERFFSNRNLVLHGTNVDYIDYTDNYLGSSVTVGSDHAIRYRMRYGNVFFHPSVMFRRDAYERSGGYSFKYSKYIEDYLLWIKMLKCGEVQIESKSLLKYRIHSGAISSSVPIGLDRVIAKISIHKGEYEGLNSDYESLIKSNDLMEIDSRSSGYKLNKRLIKILISILDFKCRLAYRLNK